MPKYKMILTKNSTINLVVEASSKKEALNGNYDIIDKEETTPDYTIDDISYYSCSCSHSIDKCILDKYVKEEKITFFITKRELIDYLNYNCPELEHPISNIKQIKKQFGKYFFQFDKRYYIINYDECLNVYKGG